MQRTLAVVLFWIEHFELVVFSIGCVTEKFDLVSVK